MPDREAIARRLVRAAAAVPSHRCRADTALRLQPSGLLDFEGLAGCRDDLDRFGRRVLVGGSVLSDTASVEELFPTSDTAFRVIDDVLLMEREFRLVEVVNRLAHTERVA